MTQTGHPSELLDSSSTIETPIGVTIELNTASVPIRAFAFLIDELIRLLIIAFMSVAFYALAQVGIGLFLLSYFVVQWFYPVFFDMLNNGRTIGKMVMNLRTIQDDGTAISFPSSFIRSILLIVDFLPLGYVAGCVSISCSAKFQRIGDLVAGTVVVHNEPRRFYAASHDGVALPLSVSLSNEERQIFVEFLYRHENLSLERRRELAETLAPIHHKVGDNAVAEVNGIALTVLRGS